MSTRPSSSRDASSYTRQPGATCLGNFLDTCYTGYMTSTSKFEFIAGSPALCFVDSHGSRGGGGKERIETPQDLFDWLGSAGLAGERPQPVTQAELGQARNLREAIYRCSLCVIRGQDFAAGDVAMINRAALCPPLRPQLKHNALVHVAGRLVEAALSVLAADALGLFASPLRGRIRQCPQCAMIFVDRSRPGRRRWCSSAQGCGNRDKVRNSRKRRAGEEGRA